MPTKTKETITKLLSIYDLKPETAIPYLIEIIKEQQEQILELKQKVNDLEIKITPFGGC